MRRWRKDEGRRRGIEREILAWLRMRVSFDPVTEGRVPSSIVVVSRIVVRFDGRVPGATPILSNAKKCFWNDGDADATMDVRPSRERHRVNDQKLNLEWKNKNRTISFIRTRRKKFLSPVCDIGDANIQSKCRMVYSREREEGRESGIRIQRIR